MDYPRDSFSFISTAEDFSQDGASEPRCLMWSGSVSAAAVSSTALRRQLVKGLIGALWRLLDKWKGFFFPCLNLRHGTDQWWPVISARPVEEVAQRAGPGSWSAFMCKPC